VVAKLWKNCSPERDTSDPDTSGPDTSGPDTSGPDTSGPVAPDREELEYEELELDDPIIDEAALPELDTEDAEAGLREPGFDDLIDRRWLERAADEDWDDERSPVDDIGLTIELDSAPDEDDGAQVVDLDVGSLLTSLPSEGTELDLEPGLMQERGDAPLGIGALRDVLLPDDDDEHDDREVGDDERFPVFDEHAERQPRGSDDESEIGPDDLS
jgi:hypothetical protein